MLARVKHEQIVIVDSDIRVGRDYLRKVLAPLSDPRVGLVTCLYRAAETPDFAAKLEAVGITAEFTAGVLMAWMLEGVSLRSARRWRRRGPSLKRSEDFTRLPTTLRTIHAWESDRAGRYEVRLSQHVVETAMQPSGLRG